MAIFVLSAKIIGRSKGQSAVAAAAYRSGERLYDEREAKAFDYTRKDGVVHSEILAPEGSPAWVFDRAQLWNNVEAMEKRKDAQLAREVLFAIPRELPWVEQLDLVRSFVREQFVSKGMVADVSFHEGVASDGGSNPHAHVLLTFRRMTPAGFEAKKAREWNAAFAREDADPFTVGTEVIRDWRAAWAGRANQSLEAAGETERIDHRSLKVQRDEALERGDYQRAARLDREPQPKLGRGWHMARRAGQVVDALRKFIGVEHRNRVRAHARSMMEPDDDATSLSGKIIDLVLDIGHAIGLSVEPPRDGPQPDKGIDR